VSAPSSPSSSHAAKSLPQLVFGILSSFGFAITVLSLLLVITLLGTLEQTSTGLYLAQRKYFESFLVTTVDIGAVQSGLFGSDTPPQEMPFFMPGGYLLMVLLFVNMVCGAVIRIRKGMRTLGILIAHCSVIFMLVAGFVSYYGKIDGLMQVPEGGKNDEFESATETSINIERLLPAPTNGKRTAWVIDGATFIDATGDKGRTFFCKDLPFEITVTGYEANADVRPATASTSSKGVIDGRYIQAVKREKEQEKNLDAALIRITHKDGRTEQGLLWRVALEPFSVVVGSETYGITLTRKKWVLPFALQLEKFVHEKHPGTERPRKFASTVTKFKQGREEKREITMNEPLREDGYAVFQQSFGQARRTDGKVVPASVFEIAQNPSDHWPLISCIGVAIGLLIHTISQLVRFLNKTGTRKVA